MATVDGGVGPGAAAAPPPPETRTGFSRRRLLCAASILGTAAAASGLTAPRGIGARPANAARGAFAFGTGPGRGTPAGGPGAGLGVIPDTPVGRMVARWLAAVNARDAAALIAFHEEMSPADEVQGRAAFDLLETRARGPLVPHDVSASTDDRLTVRLYADLSEEWLEFEFGLDPPSINVAPAAPPPDALAPAPTDEAGLRRELERYLGKLAAADVFSGAVLVARNDAPVLAAAFGRADRERGLPNRIGTRFNLGSMNKMFTAVAIAQLAERGQLDFDDPIAAFLPDYPNHAAAEQVTLHHLLTHTSGLGDFFGAPGFHAAKDRLRTPRDYFPLFAAEPLLFPPGERHEYSNAGFIVLGAVVEVVSGRDYFGYVREHVYGPAGMAASASFERDDPVPDLALGYGYPLPEDPADLTPDLALGPPRDNTDSLAIKGSPAGGGYSTVEDLLRFAGALQGNGLLRPEETRLVQAGKVATPDGPGVRYGYGFVDDRSTGSRITGHSGGAPGIGANLDMFVDLGATAIVLANCDGVARTVADKIRRLLVPRRA